MFKVGQMVWQGIFKYGHVPDGTNGRTYNIRIRPTDIIAK